MRKFKHKTTGRIATETSSEKNYKVSEPKNFTIPKWIIENSNDWVEIIEYPVGTKIVDTYLDTKGYVYEKLQDGKWGIGTQTYFTIPENSIGENKRFRVLKESEKDYQILELITNTFVGVTSCSVDIEAFENKSKSTSKWQINKIRRLSDGEEFSLGDTLKFGKKFIGKLTKIGISDCESDLGKNILTFKNDNPILGDWWKIDELNKPMHLTVSEDKVKLFEGSKCYMVYLPLTSQVTNKIDEVVLKLEHIPNPSYRLLFHSKKKAIGYITLNRPSLSINDILTIPLNERNEENLSKLIIKKYGN